VTKEVKKDPLLEPKKVKGRITTLKSVRYKGHMIYIRMIDGEIFEYLVEFGGEIYGGNLIITPSKGKKKLTGGEIDQSAALIFTGAVTTLDMLLGDELSDEQKAIVEQFEAVDGEVKDS